MVSVTENIFIDRPADEVIAFIGNYENDPRWRAGVFEVRHAPRPGSGGHEDPWRSLLNPSYVVQLLGPGTAS
jgi:hypothetical protein